MFFIQGFWDLGFDFDILTQDTEGGITTVSFRGIFHTVGNRIEVVIDYHALKLSRFRIRMLLHCWSRFHQDRNQIRIHLKNHPLKVFITVWNRALHQAKLRALTDWWAPGPQITMKTFLKLSEFVDSI